MKEEEDEENINEINTSSNQKEKEQENKIEEEKPQKKEEDNQKKEENKIEDLKLYDLTEVNDEFDENIYFSHYYLAQREMEVEPIITGKVFPYIMSREFLYSYFEDKKNYKVGVKETYPQILGRVKQFMNSNDDTFNKIFIDNIKLYTDILGKEKSETIIIPVLSKIVEDKIGTKIYFFKKLESFIEYLYNLGEEGIDLIKNNILNIFEELYRSKFNPNLSSNLSTNKKIIVTEEEQKEYDSLLFERFIQVSKILIKTENKDFIFNMLLNFKKENNFDKNEIPENVTGKKILLVKMVSNLSNDFGEEFTKEKILPLLDEFMQEDNYELKEEICVSYITLIKLLNLDFIGGYVLDSLQKVSDEKFWSLRKKCIEISYKIIYELKNKYKKENEKENKDYDKVSEYIKKIISFIEKFIDDKKKKVRMFLIEKIGEIIKPLDKNELSEKLLDFYIKTINDYYENGENLIKSENKSKNGFYFAYNFPAVLHYYSVDSWKKLKNTYFSLCNDENINVRSSIISSFFEISKILGKEITQKELLPIYDKFLEYEEKSYTRILSEKNLPKILSTLDKEIIEKYKNNVNLGYNSILSKETNIVNKYNQNKKIEYIKNISNYYTLYDNDTIYNNILPKCIYFSFDPIFKVRAASSQIIGEIVLYLYKKYYKKDKLLKLIDTYAFNKNFTQRINFIKISKSILLSDNLLYTERLKEILFTLEYKEHNFNVIYAMAKALKKIIEKENSVCGKESSIHYLCKKLELGKCTGVSNVFKNVKLQKNEKLEIVGEIPEGDVFTLNDEFFKEEFGVEINRKKSNKKENIIKKSDEDDKFIN